jgi:hypothetical protein
LAAAHQEPKNLLEMKQGGFCKHAFPYRFGDAKINLANQENVVGRFAGTDGGHRRIDPEPCAGSAPGFLEAFRFPSVASSRKRTPE